jgi:hypothetical protein
VSNHHRSTLSSVSPSFTGEPPLQPHRPPAAEAAPRLASPRRPTTPHQHPPLVCPPPPDLLLRLEMDVTALPLDSPTTPNLTATATTHHHHPATRQHPYYLIPLPTPSLTSATAARQHRDATITVLHRPPPPRRQRLFPRTVPGSAAAAHRVW